MIDVLDMRDTATRLHFLAWVTFYVLCRRYPSVSPTKIGARLMLDIRMGGEARIAAARLPDWYARHLLLSQEGGGASGAS